VAFVVHNGFEGTDAAALTESNSNASQPNATPVQILGNGAGSARVYKAAGARFNGTAILQKVRNQGDGITYTGGWSTFSGLGAGWSDGSATSVPGLGTAEYTHANCTRLQWWATLAAGRGTSKVYIDGVLQGSAYGQAGAGNSTLIYDSGPLTPGSHTLKVETNGTTWVELDHFTVVPVEAGSGTSLYCTTGVTAGQSYVGWSGGTVGSCASGQPRKDWRIYFKLDRLPTGSDRTRLVLATDASNAFIMEASVLTTGQIRLMDGFGGTEGTTVSTVSAGVWYRLEGWFTHSATAGQMGMSLFTSMDATAVSNAGDTITGSADNDTVRGGGNLTIGFGIARDEASQGVMLDGVRVHDAGTAIGPMALLSPPILPNKDADLRWKVSGPIAKDLDTRWGVASSVSKDLDARWRVTSTVTKDLDARWGVASAVSKDLDARWAVVSSVVKDLDTRWGVQVAVSKDLDARWRVTSTVTKDLDARWAVTAATTSVSKDLDTRWGVAGAVTKDLDARWGVTSAVSKDLDARWGITSSVSKDLDARWVVLSVVAPKDVDLRWKVESGGVMTFDVYNGFEGTNGAALTTANSDDNEPGSTAVQILASSTGSARVYTTSGYHLGSSALYCTTGGTAGMSYVGWSGGTVGSTAAGQLRKDWRVYFKVDRLPTGSDRTRLVLAADASTTFVMEVSVLTTGQVRLMDGFTGTEGTTVSTVTPGQWHRLEGWFTHSVTAGQISASLFTDPDSTTVAVAGDAITGSANNDTVRNGTSLLMGFGIARNEANQGVTIDGARVWDAGTPIGPAPLLAPIAAPKDVDVRWKVAQSVSKDLDARWSVGGQVSADLTVSWVTYESPVATAEFQWLVASLVTADVSLPWRVSTAVAAPKDLSLPWRVASALASPRDLSLPWRVAAQLAAPRDLSLPWAVNQGVTRDVSLLWKAAGSVSKDMELVWATTGKVTRDIGVQWGIASAVSRDVSVPWRISAAMSTPSSMGLFWRVANEIAAAKALEFRWKILQTADATDLALRWGVTAPLSQDLDLPWRVLSRVSPKDATLQWGVLGTVANRDLSIQWVLRGQAARDLSVLFSTAGRISQLLTIFYRVQSVPYHSSDVALGSLTDDTLLSGLIGEVVVQD